MSTATDKGAGQMHSQPRLIDEYDDMINALTRARTHQERTQDSAWQHERGWDYDQELRALVALRKTTEAKIEEAVIAMRAHGEPWLVIAHALDVTKQAAQQRYGR